MAENNYPLLKCVIESQIIVLLGKFLGEILRNLQNVTVNFHMAVNWRGRHVYLPRPRSDHAHRGRQSDVTSAIFTVVLKEKTHFSSRQVTILVV